MGVGLLFGLVFIGLPALSGLIAAQPVVLLPIPWIDLTRNLENLMPATPFGLATDLGLVLVGFVLPFWVVVGGFAATVFQTIANPVFYHLGFLGRWRPGMDTIIAHFSNDLDVWMSVYIGTGAAVAGVGMIQAFRALRSRLRPRRPPPRGRGDFPIWMGIALYVSAACAYIALCSLLLKDDHFPSIFLVGFAFILTPLVSYVDARMVGLTGQTVGIPLVREGAFLLSGYRGVDI